MAELHVILGERLKEIAGTVSVQSEVLNGWQVRHARFLDFDRYEYLDDAHTINVGDIWARQGETAFLMRTVTVPVDWAGQRIGLELVTGGEGLLRINGAPAHGVDDNRGYILLAESAQGGEEYTLEIEIKTGGYWEYLPTDSTTPYILSSAKLLAIDHAIESAYLDFKVAHESALAVKDAVVREAMLLAMKDTLHTVDFRDKQAPAFKTELVAAAALLREKLQALPFGNSPGTIYFNGHSHIDVVWLWPLKETMRKVGRTFSTIAALMDEYPHYYFNCSQVPLFLYLKELYPELYARIKARIAEGRFEPIGGTWVEHDTNLISGESMVRQCLYGKRFFREEFGIDVKVGWLPDVFGDSWSIPQIYTKAGLEYFMTAKFVGNEIHRFPYNTFWWQGVDGTRLFTHMVHDVLTCYNAKVKPEDMVLQWENYIGKLSTPEVLSPYGWGDGGGGPTRAMLDYIPRLTSMPGIPHAATGRVDAYFEKIAAESTELPVWNGEIYYERHRGTYTSQAKNKKYNRESELLLREAELFGVLSGRYAKAALTNAWQTVLLNQFHDALPGSSIQDVYVESHQQYAQVLATGAEARTEALQALAARADTNGDGTPVVVFNSLGWSRSELVTIAVNGAFRAIGPDGTAVPCQPAEGGISFVATVPACGFAVYHLVPDAEEATPFTCEGNRYATPYYEFTLGDDGSITRLYDRVHQREVLPEGVRANTLQVFEDKPGIEEAWDIDFSYQEKMWEFTAVGTPEVTACGPQHLTISRKLVYGSSTLWQDMTLYAHSPRIDFATRVDWQERQTLLKAAIPVDIHASRATYEIAFGAIERPTHWSTDWDRAKFEVCGHKWADLSEPGYGVSILNDSKFGWDIKDNVMRLTLLRSPMFPDPEADRGEHTFCYALLPHTGDWTTGTVQAGYGFNVPLQPVVTPPHAGALGAQHSYLSIDQPNVIIDTVKQAEDSDDVIIRVYEAHGARGQVTLTLDRPIASAVETNLLEEDEQAATFNGSTLSFQIKPFEIRTFKLQLQS